MSSSYDGIGYIGQIDTLGNIQNGIYPVQRYLDNPGNPAANTMVDSATAEAARILNNPSADDSYFFSFIKQEGFPQTVQDLIVNFRTFMYTQVSPPLPGVSGTLDEKMAAAKSWLQTNAPNELDYQWPSGGMYDQSLQFYLNATGLLNSDRLVYVDGSATPVLFSTLSATDQKNYLSDLFDKTFSDFASKFVYQAPTPPAVEDMVNGTPVAPGTDRTMAWLQGFSSYLQNIVSVDATNADMLGYQAFYNAFFMNNPNISSSINPPPSELFSQFFAKFLQQVSGDPTQTSPSGYFTPSLFYDKWTQDVMQYYLTNLNGSTPLNPTGADDGSQKTFVLNRIFSLLVLMIESLQKVAAAQSDRLLVYSKWQSAYTDLQNNIKFVTENDSRFHKSLSGNASRRTDFNSANTSYTEIIKARKQTIADDAKNLQTQVNQSSDAVDQEASMATSILQELSSILSSLYR